MITCLVIVLMQSVESMSTSDVSEVTRYNRFYCSAAMRVFSSSMVQSNQLRANTRIKRLRVHVLGFYASVYLCYF